MDNIYLEWQRLRRIEKALIEYKAMCFAPCVTRLSSGLNIIHFKTADVDKTNVCLTNILLDVGGKFMPDDVEMAMLRGGDL